MRNTASAAFAAQQQQRLRRELFDELLKDATQDGGATEERKPAGSSGPGGSGPASEPRKPPPLAPSARRAAALLRLLHPTAMALALRPTAGVSGGTTKPAPPAAGPWRKPLPQPWIRTPRSGEDQSDSGTVQSSSDRESHDDLRTKAAPLKRSYCGQEAPYMEWVRENALATAEVQWRRHHDMAKPLLGICMEAGSAVQDDSMAALEIVQQFMDSESTPARGRAGSGASTSAQQASGRSAPSTEELLPAAREVVHSIRSWRRMRMDQLERARREWGALRRALRGGLGDQLRGTFAHSTWPVEPWVTALEALRPGLTAGYPDTWGRLVEAARREEKDPDYRRLPKDLKGYRYPDWKILTRAVSGVGLLAGSSLPDACLDPLACAMLDVLAEDLWRLQVHQGQPVDGDKDPYKTSLTGLLHLAPKLRLPSRAPATARRLSASALPYGLSSLTRLGSGAGGAEAPAPSQVYSIILIHPVHKRPHRGSWLHYRDCVNTLHDLDVPLEVQLATWRLAMDIWIQPPPDEDLKSRSREMGRVAVVAKKEARGGDLRATEVVLSFELGTELALDLPGPEASEESDREGSQSEEEQDAEEGQAGRGGGLGGSGRQRGRAALAGARRVPRSPSSTCSRNDSPSRAAGKAASAPHVGLYDVLYGTGPFRYDDKGLRGLESAAASSMSGAGLASAAAEVLSRLEALGLSAGERAASADASGPAHTSSATTASALGSGADSAAASARAEPSTLVLSPAGAPADADRAVAGALSQLLLMGRELTSALGGVGLPAAALPLLRLERCLARARDDRIEGQLLEARAEDAWLGAVRAARQRATARSEAWAEARTLRRDLDPFVDWAIKELEACGAEGQGQLSSALAAGALVGARALVEDLRPGLVAAHSGTWGRLLERVEAGARVKGADAEALHEVCRWALKGLALLVGFEGLPRARLGLACCALGGRMLEERGVLDVESHALRCTALLLYLCCMPPLILFPPPPEEGWAGGAGASPASQPLCTGVGVGNSCSFVEAARRLGAMPHELYITLASFALGCLQRSSSPHGPADEGRGMQPSWPNGGGRGDGGGKPLSRGWLEAHARDVAVLCAQALAEAPAGQAHSHEHLRSRRSSSSGCSGWGEEELVYGSGKADASANAADATVEAIMDEFLGTSRRLAFKEGTPIELSSRLPGENVVDVLQPLFRVGHNARRRQLRERASGSDPGRDLLLALHPPVAGAASEDGPQPLGLVLADAEAAALVLALCWNLSPLPKAAAQLSYVSMLVGPQPAGGLAGGSGSVGAGSSGAVTADGSGTGPKGVDGLASALPPAVALTLGGSVPVSTACRDFLHKHSDTDVSAKTKLRDLLRGVTRKLVEAKECTVMLRGRGVVGAMLCLQLAATVRQAMQAEGRDLATMPYHANFDAVRQVRQEADGRNRRSRSSAERAGARLHDVLEFAVDQLYEQCTAYTNSAESSEEYASRLGVDQVINPGAASSRMQATGAAMMVQNELKDPDGPARENLAVRVLLVECEPGRPDRPLWPAKALAAEASETRLRAGKRGVVRGR
ncbi:hypothetical protein HYH03_007054 [Edaphochlamys debaryana]|uniref:Uncharacterized protein n=1 Tax=Edaphochlamys debaryana TaxID=47281 RepID=A0A835Y5Z6_9CHLO|nr:hypothetical protein HYH03_007054 [Edaphochlamys debaryana]|eukprot:KAG2494811.1 hypothetical protein HYH03_007054 [Edaphochlamys debaryana]